MRTTRLGTLLGLALIVAALGHPATALAPGAPEQSGRPQDLPGNYEPLADSIGELRGHERHDTVHGLEHHTDPPDNQHPMAHVAKDWWAGYNGGALSDGEHMGASLAPKCFASGHRFTVFYVYPMKANDGTAITSHLNDTVRAFIRGKLGYAEYYLNESSWRHTQRVRWECNASNQIVIRSAAANGSSDGSAHQDLSIDEVENAIRSAGFTVCRMGCTNTPTSFVAMVDMTTNNTYGGLGWPGADAPSNKDPYAARGGVVADIRQWIGPTILHEIMHTQGSVLRNAPNSDGQHHCTGDHDVMCGSYGDGNDPCPYHYHWVVDCAFDSPGGDTNGTYGEPVGQRAKEDYWDPTGGQYFLSTSWNTADSLWFTRPALK
ncbi:MAG TPA: hypothetical protein VEU29_08070 [Actinomycetota bacterium]|nr:hypothetical protein [Actinomycetota bacterium]